MKLIICLSFVLVGLGAWAQPENAEIEIVNGKRYYVHIVQGGNTLYGIHKLYNVPVEDIVAENPETAKGLAEGQRILVPIKGIESSPITLGIHTVVAQETLYGISKTYETTIEKLVELNPGIELGLKEGQEIKVPVKLPIGKGEPLKELQNEFKVSFTDSVIKHTVMKGETIFSISKRFMVPVDELKKINGNTSDKLKPGDIINIPVKKERIEKVEIRKITTPKPVLPTEVTPKDKIKPLPQPKDTVILFKKKDEYKIAILAPFFLDKGDKYSASVSNLAAEYYMGTKFALDSLKALGFKAKVHIIDSQKGGASMDSILKGPEFQNVDLIIGPFFGNSTETVALWCKDHGVRLICPVETSPEILRNNPFVYESVTSGITLAEGMANFLKKNHNNEQIIFVKPSSKNDLIIHEGFRAAFNGSDNNADSLPKVIETDVKNFTSFIGNGKNLQIVFLSSDKTEVMDFMTALNKASADSIMKGKVTLYGTKDWENFNNIEDALLTKFNVHFATPYNLNYKNNRTKNFDSFYHKTYRTRVSKMALQGYDVTMYFCQYLLMDKIPKVGIMNDFKMEQKGIGNGYENVSCVIMRHNDYRFVKLTDINE
jgi:LysM repeat protein